MIRPPKISKAMKEYSGTVLARYIQRLEGYIKEYEKIDYRKRLENEIEINETISEQKDLIQKLTNMLEPINKGSVSI